MRGDSVSPEAKRQQRGAGFAGLVLLMLLVASQGAIAGGCPEWVEVHSSHFSVYTDACQKRGQEVAAQFEEMRNVFGELMSQMTVDSPVPTQIVAFKDAQEFQKFTPLWKGRPTRLSGVFVGGSLRNFILLNLSVNEPWQVVFHEYAHQLLAANSAVPVDPWFDEGFAEYFSTGKISGGEMLIGQIRDETLTTIRQNGMMKVGDLFRVDRESRTYRENGPRQVLFYAQSALVVHFLMDHGLLPKVASYFDLTVNEDVPVEQAIQQAFGMSASEMDKALAKYRKASVFVERHLPLTGATANPNFAVRQVPDDEANALFLDIHLQAPDYRDKTAEQLEERLRQDPANAVASRGLGYFFLQNQDYDSAEKYFDMAAHANSSDARVHYYSAYLASNRGTFGERSTLPEILNELQKAIALDPGLADAYALWGFAELYRGNADRAIQLARKAVNLEPHNEKLKYQLAQIYWLSDRPRESAEILQRLKTKDVQLAQKVHELLEQAQDAMNDNGKEDAHHETTAGESSSVVPQGDTSPAEPAPAGPSPSPSGTQGVIKFLKGTIHGVDCTHPRPSALTVAAGANLWTMRIPERGDVVVIGADRLSCSWNSRKIAVNYRVTGDYQGDVVSLEVQ